MQGFRKAENEVAGRRAEGVKDNGQSATAAAVGHVRGEEDDDEGEEVGRGGEGLGREAAVAHAVYNFGEKDGERRVGHIDHAKNEGGENGDGVDDDGEDVAPGEAAWRAIVGTFFAQPERRNFSLARSEVARRLRIIRHNTPRNYGHNH